MEASWFSCSKQTEQNLWKKCIWSPCRTSWLWYLQLQSYTRVMFSINKFSSAIENEWKHFQSLNTVFLWWTYFIHQKVNITLLEPYFFTLAVDYSARQVSQFTMPPPSFTIVQRKLTADISTTTTPAALMTSEGQNSISVNTSVETREEEECTPHVVCLTLDTSGSMSVSVRCYVVWYHRLST